MSTQTVRQEKSLYGINCCFCEESLEYTLANEKVVGLECGHTCHHECLFELIDTSLPLIIENFDVVMPRCSTCGEPGVPLDGSLHLDLLKKKLASLPETKLDHTSLKGAWTPGHNLSSRATKSVSSLDSDQSQSHRSQSSVSSVDSADFKSAHAIQEISLAIPNRILESRIRQAVPPKIEIVPEVETVIAKSTYISGSKGPKDIYVTSAVTVKIPVDNQQLSPTTTRNSSQLMQDSELQERVTNYILESIPDWKNLDVSLFGKIRLCDKFQISPDQKHWQRLDCYLFETILVFVRRYTDGREPQLKGSVAIRDHLTSISLPSTGSRWSHQLTLNLSTDRLPVLYMKTSDTVALENWYAALVDWNSLFMPHRLVPADDADGLRLAGIVDGTVPRLPTSSHMPTDTVILVPLSGSPNGSKFPAIRNTILSVMREMTLFDRVAIVPYGTNGQQYVYGLAYNTWKPWKQVVESIKPTGTTPTRGDMMAGLKTAFTLLEDRTTKNPVTSVLIISDSLSDLAEEDLNDISQRAADQSIKVHSFGVTNNHSADRLERISSRCCGNYFYLRKWSELYQVSVGLFRSIQSYSYCNLSVSLDATPGVRIVGIAGHNPKVALSQSPRAVKVTPLSPTDYTMERVSSMMHLVELGDMTMSEERTFLVQVRISSDAIPMEISSKSQSQFELFTSTLAFSSFAGPAEDCLHRDEFFIPAGSVYVTVESLNAFIQDLIQPAIRPESRVSGHLMFREHSRSSSVYGSTSLPPSPVGGFSGPQDLQYEEEVSPMPSIVYGDLVSAGAGGTLTPMCLSLEKHDIRVVQRRIQLTAINILEHVVRIDLKNKTTAEIVNSIESGRAMIRGLLGCCKLHNETAGLGNRGVQVEEPDRLRAISVDVEQLAEILDMMLCETRDKIREVNSFEEDFRKLLIQNIGILRNEKGYTLRTPLEALFLQRQDVNNVL